MKSFFFLVCVFLVCSSSKNVEWYDSFDQGTFNPADSSSSYFYFTEGDYVANDGTLTPTQKGLVTNVYPFIKTVAQSPYGVLDHVKNLFFHKTFWTVQTNEILRCEIKQQFQYFPASNHFGDHVTNENNDLRLGTCGLVMLDTVNWIVADFFQTNEENIPFYERLPFGKTDTYNYKAFSSLKMGVNRRNKNLQNSDRLAIEYDRANHKLTYFVNGEKVHHITNIGHPAADMDLIQMQDGPEETIDVTRFLCGMGCFTMMDMQNPLNLYDPDGLVRLISPNVYTIPNVFYDDLSLESNRIWGQGAVAVREHFLVSKE